MQAEVLRTDPDAIDAVIGVFSRIGQAYPALAGFFSTALVVLVVTGAVAAQFDPERLRAAGWPRAATFVEWATRIGSFAIRVWKRGQKGAPS